MDWFMYLFFCVCTGIMGTIGAIYYHFAFGVGEMKRELAEAKKKIAAMEAAEKDALIQQLMAAKRGE